MAPSCLRDPDHAGPPAQWRGHRAEVVALHPGRAGDDADAPRVGPNAVLQLIEAFRAAGETPLMLKVFTAAGCAAYMDAPPTDRIPEADAAALFAALHRIADPQTARAIAADAGRRTAAYVMGRRIPAFARVLLKALPPRMAAPILAQAVRRNAWTFCGSGAVSVSRLAGRSATIEVRVRGNALATPGCPWHSAVFERLFGALAGPRVSVRHVACEGHGADACRFEITP